MAFSPNELTTPTLKGMVHRLHKHLKSTPQPSTWPPKQAEVQEWMARGFNFQNWHEAQTVTGKNGTGQDTSSAATYGIDWNSIWRQAEDLTGSSINPAHTLVGMPPRQRAGFFDWLIARHPQTPWLRIEGALAHQPRKTSFQMLESGLVDWWLARVKPDEIRPLAAFFLHPHPAGGGDMWPRRAMEFLQILLEILCWQRDHLGLILDFSTVQEHLHFDSVVRLSRRRDLPAALIMPLRDYLRFLPGYVDRGPHQNNTQNDTVVEQHGFLVMQIRRFHSMKTDPESLLVWTLPASHETGFEDAKRLLRAVLPVWLTTHPGCGLLLDGIEFQTGLSDFLLPMATRLQSLGVAVYLGIASPGELGPYPQIFSGFLERGLMTGFNIGLYDLMDIARRLLLVSSWPQNLLVTEVAWLEQKRHAAYRLETQTV